MANETIVLAAVIRGEIKTEEARAEALALLFPKGKKTDEEKAEPKAPDK